MTEFWSDVADIVRRPVRRLLGAREKTPETRPSKAPPKQVRVLFVDVGNASRSQIAKAFATLAGFRADSAGTFPAMRLAPEAVATMAEVDIDITVYRPKPLDTSQIASFDRIVTFGRPMPAPLQNRPNVEDWNVMDPNGLGVNGYAQMRADIERRVKALARRHGVKAPHLVALEA